MSGDTGVAPGYLHGFDPREQDRLYEQARFIEYWTALLLSGAPGLLKAGRVTPRLAAQMRRELTLLKNDPDAVFFYSHIRAQARA